MADGRRLLRPVAVAVSAAVGLGIALYLTATRLAGGLPACGPVEGCDTVALSEYSVIAGVPVAFLGAAFSAALLAVVAEWLRARDRRLLGAGYGLATLGVVFVAYLTYLELFVIHAICIWCVGYALAVVAVWVLLALEMAGASGSRQRPQSM
jgi:uncharacterized membrane protein